MTDAIAAETTKKTASKVAEKVADTNILPTVAEVAEVAVKVPSKFIVSGKLVAGVAAGAALGAGGYYAFQKFQEKRRAKKIIVPNDASSLDVK